MLVRILHRNRNGDQALYALVQRRQDLDPDRSEPDNGNAQVTGSNVQCICHWMVGPVE
jgi:hypothetical protein